MTYKTIFARKLGSRIAGCLLAALLAASTLTYAQTAAVNPVVPNIVNYNGALADASGKPLTAISGVRFSLYQDSEGGAPLWMEIQNIQPDSRGHFSARLGYASGHGLPTDLFASGEARWLGVQVEGQAEQPRVLLLSVPYALKAADAETLGGMPASAFVLAVPASGEAESSRTTSSTSAAANVRPPASSDVTTTGGTVNAIPLFTTATNIQNSIVTQTGTTAVNVAGKLNLPATGAATATAGRVSRPEAFVASSFNHSTSTTVNQTFQLQAEPVANDTANPSGTLNLLYGLGATTPSETGLKISNKGLITFAAGQTFPGTTKGTVTSVGLTAPASDFTVSASPVTSAGTLNFAWKVAPASADTANAIIKRDATGSFNVTNIIGTGTFSSNTANTFAITGSTSLDGGTAIVGSSTVTGGSNPSYGVYGNSASIVAGSTGVLGQDGSTTGAGFTMGVQGVSSNQRNGMGVFGFDGISLSTVFQSFQAGNDLFEGAGVWGDGGTSISAANIGVIGTVDDGVAGYFVNNSSSGKYTLEANAYNANSFPFLAFNAENGAGCSVDPSGNLNCTGSKNAVVPVDGGKRIVAMSAIESPQNWFEDFGSAQLVNGVAMVTLDQDFIQTVNSDTNYKVFPVPNGECKGVYVTNKTANSFEVRELGGGTSNIGFDYRITVLRKNYENVRFADHTHDLDGVKKMQGRMKAGTGKPAHMPTAAKQP